MNIAILGYGLEGQSAHSYWQTAENVITVCDQSPALELPHGTKSKLGQNYLDNLDGFDLIIRSPGIKPDDIAAANNMSILRKVTSATNEFLEVCPTRNIIGVTGTKGKGTTCTLIAKMLEAAGKTVHLGGNIGTPALELLKNDITSDDWVILELSSFQLIDLKSSPNISVCLMVVPEHLNWHSDMAEYVNAKQQLFVWQTYDDIAIYFPENEYSATIASAGNGAKVPYGKDPGAIVANGSITIGGQEICSVSELALLGEHNQQNACAAVTTAWQITHSVSAIKSVLTTFSGLPHRLEHIRDVSGVAYYDDSFGTTPETAIVAMQAFAQPKVLILGGSDKGADYAELAEAVKISGVKKVLLIGDEAARIQTALQKAGYVNFISGGETMQQIVRTAQSESEDGDVVLLSTGCASFGLFKDYKDRGNQFQAAVHSL